MGRVLDVLQCNIKRYKSKMDTVTYPLNSLICNPISVQELAHDSSMSVATGDTVGWSEKLIFRGGAEKQTNLNVLHF